MYIRIIFSILTCFELCGTVFGEQLCTDFLKFDEAGDIRKASFDVSFGRLNNFLQVTAIVSEECQEGSCYIHFEKPERTTAGPDLNVKPLRFDLLFSKTANKAWVAGIVVRNTSKCHVLCTQNIEKLGLKSLQVTYYPYGEADALKAPCEPIDTYQSSIRLDETCGMIMEKPKFLELAIGGTPVKRGDWPWLVAVYHGSHNNRQFMCGGSLVNRRAILTAAHCLLNASRRPLRPQEIGVQLGCYDLSSFCEEGSPFYRAHNIVIHNDFRQDGENRDSDIGLIIVESDVNYTPFIRPACIWLGDDNIDKVTNQIGTVVGWGMDEDKIVSPIPKKVTAKITSYENCIKSDDAFTSITTKRNLCAGNLDGTGPCKGDSGGALMLEVSGRWTIRGVVSASLGDKECDLYKYVVYTDIAKYKDWLIRQIPRSFVPVTSIFSHVSTHETYEQTHRDYKLIANLKDALEAAKTVKLQEW